MTTVPQNATEARQSHLESLFWRRALNWGLRSLPLPLQRASIPVWSAFFYLQVPHVRRAIEQNLGRLLGLRPPRRQLMAFRTFTNYCHCIANAYRYFAGGPLLLQAEIQGREHMARALATGEGAILATGHVGNWHLGPHFLAQHGFPQVTVVMEQEPDPQVQQLEVSLRDSRLRVVYPRQSPLLSLDLRAALNRGELLGFQMDRPLANRGVRVPVANSHATFAAGPALLARTCEVPVVPVFFPLHEGKLVVQVHPPLRARRTHDRDADLLELTSRLAAIYTGIIRRYPDQWFNFFSFWD